MAKKAKPKQAEKQSTHSLQLAIINPTCGAIDVGSTLMNISYTDKDGHHHKLETDAYTESLEGLAETMKQDGVTCVAMEATGVYWMMLHEILESKGIEVKLVNAHHFKNVAGQKTDFKDSEWLHQLNAHGLLRGSHVPQEIFRELRSYIHERNILQDEKSDTLNRIQKLLTQMNIKMQHLISDVEGVSSMKVLRAIAEGESDPQKLLDLLNSKRLKASETDLLKSLKGIYKSNYVNILGMSLRKYDFLKQEMQAYEKLIEEVLTRLLPKGQDIKPKKTFTRKNEYSINLKDYFHEILGTDLTEVSGIKEKTIMDVISVTGTNMEKWPTDGHFTSWLDLASRPKISGGKVIGHDHRGTTNKASQAFRLAAQTLHQSKCPLGSLYRKLLHKKGAKKAIKAMARRLAVIFYHMVKNKSKFDLKKVEENKDRLLQKKVKALEKEATRIGYRIEKLIA